MAKGSGKKASRKSKGAPGRDRGAKRLEKALAAGLRREAKAASRLQAAQLEVAVLRMALAEVVGDLPAKPAPVATTDVAVVAEPKRAAARPRRADALVAEAPSKPAAVKQTPAARPRRTTRPAPADR